MLTKRVSVIPEWYNNKIIDKSTIAKIQNDKRFSQIKKEFNVLLIGTLTSNLDVDDRKNIKNTIKWLCQEFKNKEDVGVILKTNFGKGSTADKEMCRNYLTDVLKEFRTGQYPSFYFVHGNMKKEEIAGLITHNKVKLYASATRGEGYGLPLIEAAVAGKPIVATNWSGHLEFLQRENFGNVDYDLVEISESKVDGRIFQKGFRWANPLETSFKSEVRKVYTDYKTAKEKAKIMKKHIQFNFNSGAIEKKYDELFMRVTE